MYKDYKKKNQREQLSQVATPQFFPCNLKSSLQPISRRRPRRHAYARTFTMMEWVCPGNRRDGHKGIHLLTTDPHGGTVEGSSLPDTLQPVTMAVSTSVKLGCSTGS